MNKNKNQTSKTNLEPPPLPATLPPVGSHMKQKITTTTTTFTSGSNLNNNPGNVRTTTWHTQSHYNSSNNNGDGLNNFLDNERAASTIPAG